MVELLEREAVVLQRKKLPPDKVCEAYLKKATNFSRSWGKRLAFLKNLKEECVRALFAEAQQNLERNPQSIVLQVAT